MRSSFRSRELPAADSLNPRTLRGGSQELIRKTGKLDVRY
jgi:hypothetical protein